MFVAGMLTDLVFIDVKGLVQPFLAGALMSIKRICGAEIENVFIPRFDGFLLHAAQVAQDKTQQDAAEELALTLKFLCEERQIFEVDLHRCFTPLLHLYRARLDTVVEVFYAADDVNVAAATFQAEVLLKGFYGMQLACADAFRRHCAWIASNPAASLAGDHHEIVALWRTLLRFVLAPKCPVPNTGPAGIAFCFLLLASAASVAQSAHYILHFFFPSLLPADAPPVGFDPSATLLIAPPFRNFVASLAPLPLTMLLRGLVIAGPAAVVVPPCDGAPVPLVQAFFPAFCALAESTTSCEQSTRVAVFQSLSIVCHKLREVFEGPTVPGPADAASAAAAAPPAPPPPPHIRQSLGLTPEAFYALLGRLLRLTLAFWEESNDGIVIQVKSQFGDLCALHTLAPARGVDAAQHAAFTEQLFAQVAKLRWVQKAKVRIRINRG